MPDQHNIAEYALIIVIAVDTPDDALMMIRCHESLHSQRVKCRPPHNTPLHHSILPVIWLIKWHQAWRGRWWPLWFKASLDFKSVHTHEWAWYYRWQGELRTLYWIDWRFTLIDTDYILFGACTLFLNFKTICHARAYHASPLHFSFTISPFAYLHATENIYLISSPRFALIRL
jgi:hypothetical protein